MNIVFRVDASTEIGTGHIMRCVTLAKRLIVRGAHIRFICRNLHGNSILYLQESGFQVDEISTDEDEVAKVTCLLKSYKEKIELLIVDHYDLDIQWEIKMRPFTKKIMVIDDLANRKHDCDILLDQNYYINIYGRYEDLVPEHCSLLLGPDYVLLREEFLIVRKEMKVRTGKVNRLLIFFGGTDPTNETEKTLQGIESLISKYELNLDVVVGNANPNKMIIEKICKSFPRTKYHCQVGNMAELMAKADLSIGAGGSTTWERCFLKLPSLSIVVAENQRKITQAVAAQGATINLGDYENVSINHIQEKLKYCFENPDFIKEISKQSGQIINVKKVMQDSIIKEILEAIS